MAAKKKAAAAAGAVGAAKSNPYVQRLIEDDELRDNLRVAVDATRDAYSRLNNGKAPAKVLMDDKKFHKDLQQAAEALREAGTALSGRKRKKKGGMGKLMFVGIVGAIAAVALSSELRSKLLDALFGAEEEFEYTSTTSPDSQPAGTPAASTTT